MKQNLFKKATVLLLVFSFLLGPFNLTPAYAQTAPTLVAPANGSTKTANNGDTPPLGIPEFEWSPVSGTTTYRIQISGDIAFTTLIVNEVTTNTRFTPISSAFFTDGTWYWHVRVEAPTSSAYSNTWKFTKQWATATNLPTLISPADNATIDFYDSPAFSWNPVTGAASYQVQFATTSNGWATPVLVQTTRSTAYQPNLKLANGTYYWRVVPMDPSDRFGTPSSFRTFTAAYLTAPTLLQPNDNATPTFTPTFRWTAVRGAQYYTLQYGTTSDFTANVTTVLTNNTTFTPTASIPNDVNYYWRVKAHSGASISNWTTGAGAALGRTFIKRWYIKPVPLTPTLNYQNQRFPVFSWAPVPGAAFYKLELDLDIGFSPPIYNTIYTANTSATPNDYFSNASPTDFFWRITPYDGNGQTGKSSDTFQYKSYGGEVSPHQVYPPYYYPPDTYAGFPTVTTNPHEDRTVPLPIFIWHRVYKPAYDPNQGEDYAAAYRVQVDNDPLFGSPEWTVDTQNSVAAPTSSNPFTPTANTNYFWRVRPLDGMGGTEIGTWSQTWKTRFNLAAGLTPGAAGTAPVPIRPSGGTEFANSTPMLEWFPVTGATSYDVQISLEQNFNSTVDTATVPYPMYAPTQSFAQRSLGAVDFGVYYWRVRQSPNGTWSSVRRFQIAAQSQWRYARELGNLANQLQIGSDPAGDTSNANYDLTDLFASESISFWYFGFHVPSSPSQNVTYALYLDLDHVAGSGATFDAYTPAYNMSTIAGYQPEYAIYILQESGNFSASRTFLYHWTGIDWGTPTELGSIGGALDKNGDYVELEIPNTSIGHDDTGGSYTASLLSLPAGGSAAPADSVPSDPNVPGAGAISRFSSVTERMNLLSPPNNGGVDPYTYPSVPVIFWDYPAFAPWGGANMKTYLDPDFTTEVATFTLTTVPEYYAQTARGWGNDLLGDTTYYWRVQPRYYVSGQYYQGVWSQGSRFERKGFVPQNLQTSVSFATPTFSWDMVEGAEGYTLQYDDDPNFGSPFTEDTKQNSFTSLNTLPGGTYFWRVRMRRNGNVINSWSPSKSFTLTLPTPTGLSPASATVVSKAPTYCWTPLIKNDTQGNATLAAYTYSVQISLDPAFSTIFDSAITEQSCWTPYYGYPDGQYYWRVAMRDGTNNIQGPYTANQTFTKQYPTTTLVSPISGSTTNSMPTFRWTHVDGAAGYRLQVSDSPTFSPIYQEVSFTDNISYTPVFNYAIGKTYYWRVAIIDRDNKIGPYNSAQLILNPPTITFSSVAKHDGWVLESAEIGNKGASMSGTVNTLNVGDDASKKQYRSILSFSTGDNLPDNAVITGITLKLKKHSFVGGSDLVNTFQGFLADVKNGFFGTNSSLEKADFQSTASKNCGPFKPSLVNDKYNINLICAKDAINKLATNNGLTQIRIRFKLDDNNNSTANFIKLYSGDSTNTADRPQLVITYYVP